MAWLEIDLYGTLPTGWLEKTPIWPRLKRRIAMNGLNWRPDNVAPSFAPVS